MFASPYPDIAAALEVFNFATFKFMEDASCDASNKDPDQVGDDLQASL